MGAVSTVSFSREGAVCIPGFEWLEHRYGKLRKAGNKEEQLKKKKKENKEEVI